MAIERTPEGKIKAKYPTFEWVEANAGDYVGWCIACGSTRECVEPDARRYECEECGLRYVYGAEELVIMGLVQ